MSRFHSAAPPLRPVHIVPMSIRRLRRDDLQYQQRQLFADWLAARRANIIRLPLRAFRDYLVDRRVFQRNERLTPGTLRMIRPFFGFEFNEYLYRGDKAPVAEIIARVRQLDSDPKTDGLYIEGVPEGSRYYRPPPGPLTPLRRTPDPWELEEARLMQIELRTIAANDQQEHREQFAAWLGDRADVVSPRRMYKQWRGVAVEHPTHGWTRGMRPHARLGRDVHEQLGAKLVDLISLSPPIKRSLLRAILDPPPTPTPDETPPCT